VIINGLSLVFLFTGAK